MGTSRRKLRRAREGETRGVRICHYCDEPATTRDHIVPRALALYLGSNLGQINVVPACQPCNGRKGMDRSDCPCMRCRDAWDLLGPAGWQDLPVVVMSKKVKARRQA